MARFITFEGINGAGKSVQARQLALRLEQAGYPVLQVREPGSTEMAEEIRCVLEHSHETNPIADLFLFLAARASLVTERILPFLEAGGVVICDRFVDSTLAYQRGVPRDEVRKLNWRATGGLMPDITVYLDITPDVAFERRKASGRFTVLHQRQIHEAATQREIYHELVSEEPSRFLVVSHAMNAQQEPLVIAEQIYQRIVTKLDLH